MNGLGQNTATFSPNVTPNQLSVTKSFPSGYVPGFASNINSGAGQPQFYVQVGGFNPVTDPEIIGLDLAHAGSLADTTAGEEATLAQEINGANGQQGVALTAVPFANASPNLQALFPNYDLFLIATGPTSAPMDWGINLLNDNGIGGLVVTNMVVVPEPASAAIAVLGAGLMLGRRRKRAVPTIA
jgi:hypothetical protein